MIDPVQLRDYVIRPVLKYLEPEIPYSLAAEHLLLGTAAQESKLRYLHQLGKGPAVGLWQMEPNTHDDIWENFLKRNPKLFTKVFRLTLNDETEQADFLQHRDEMVGNLYYACAMARVYYWRIRESLPPADDAFSMGVYWKRHYNTPAGAGTVEQFVESWKLIAVAI